jgi:hypothetical protein
MASRDTSDAGAVASEEDKSKLRDGIEQDALKSVLGTFEGRSVLFKILARSAIYQDIYSTDSAEVHRELGRRSIGLELLAEILTVDPGVYIVMQQESEAFDRKFNIRERDDYGD